MDGTVNATAAKQRRIRRVYDCVSVQFGDVALFGADHGFWSLKPK
jgi:hypothetical protein